MTANLRSKPINFLFEYIEDGCPNESSELDIGGLAKGRSQLSFLAGSSRIYDTLSCIQLMFAL